MSEKALHYPHKIPPAPADWLEVADGIYWLRFPLRLALNHVHVWLLRDGTNGWFCIDSGWGGAPTHALWDQVIAEKLGGKPITRLLVTHYHPDHIGSAGYLYEKFQPEILMSQVEWLTARMLALDTQFSMREINLAHYTAMGIPAEVQAMLTNSGNHYAQAVDLPPPRFTPLVAGDTITIDGSAWNVLIGGGHAPAQISLFNAERDIYIAADQVLPRISPNVSVWASNPHADALADYMATLHDIRSKTTETALTLPSHNLPFSGLHARLGELLQHHDERMAQIADLCRDEPLTVHQIAERVFDRTLDRTQTVFAIGEMLAHVNRMLARGALKRENPGDLGACRFKKA